MNRINLKCLTLGLVWIVVVNLNACKTNGVGVSNAGSISLDIEAPCEISVGETIYPKVVIENKSNKPLSKFSVILFVSGKEVQKVAITNGPSPGGKDILSRDGGFKMSLVGNFKLEAIAMDENGNVDANCTQYIKVNSK
jgi:hypothetical protein